MSDKYMEVALAFYRHDEYAGAHETATVARAFRWRDSKQDELREVELCQHCSKYDYCKRDETFKESCVGFMPTGKREAETCETCGHWFVTHYSDKHGECRVIDRYTKSTFGCVEFARRIVEKPSGEEK